MSVITPRRVSGREVMRELVKLLVRAVMSSFEPVNLRAVSAGNLPWLGDLCLVGARSAGYAPATRSRDVYIRKGILSGS